MIRVALLLISLLMLLAACGGNQEPTPAPLAVVPTDTPLPRTTSIQTNALESTIASTLKPMPTATPMLPTNTATSTATPLLPTNTPTPTATLRPLTDMDKAYLTTISSLEIPDVPFCTQTRDEMALIEFLIQTKKYPCLIYHHIEPLIEIGWMGSQIAFSPPPPELSNETAALELVSSKLCTGVLASVNTAVESECGGAYVMSQLALMDLVREADLARSAYVEAWIRHFRPYGDEVPMPPAFLQLAWP